jgi:pimeloyl-ACP methyl ester carboxylesterase
MKFLSRKEMKFLSRKEMKFFVTLIVISFLTGCASDPFSGPIPQSKVERSWRYAERYVPKGINNPPVVVFLHGCTGITEGNRQWAGILRNAGYMVILPMGYGSGGCNSSTKISYMTDRTLYERAEEAAYAAAQLRPLHPPKLILMGQSQGALAIQYWTQADEAGYDAAIITGTGCTKLNLPYRMPVLIGRYERDPWDAGLVLCDVWAKQRPSTELHTLPGSGHDPAGDPALTAHVLAFLQHVQAH